MPTTFSIAGVEIPRVPTHLTLKATIPGTSLSGTLREIALLSTSSAGTMYWRHVMDDDIEMTAAKQYFIEMDFMVTDKSGEGSIVTKVGLETIRDILDNLAPTTPGHMAWATGVAPLNEEDTTLEGETERNAIDSRVRSNALARIIAILAASEADGDTITKSALFDAASNGNMLCESLFKGIVKNTRFLIQAEDKWQVF